MFKHAEAQFALLAFSSLFSVINPISAAPIFVVLTEGSPQERRRVALRACIAAAVILAIFAAAGGAIFAFFGITVPAFQIAGGIIFTIMSMRALETGREDIPQDDLEKAMEGTIRTVCKVGGKVEFAKPGSLPNDGKVIDDVRKYT